MRVTEYGKQLCEESNDSQVLEEAVGDKTGAEAHVAALGADAGLIIVVTGPGHPAARYGAVSAAYFAMLGRRDFHNAWHVGEDGKRRLVIQGEEGSA